MKIHEIIKDYNNLNSKHLFEKINNGRDLTKLIKLILTDQIKLRKVASLSYTHPNGFDKILIPLEKSSNGYLRIHIWWAKSLEKVRKDIHNHQWDFKSKVLLGTLRFSIYSGSKYGEDFRKYECKANPYNLNGLIRQVGSKRLIKTIDITLKKGSEYTLNHNTIHVVQNNPSENTITLVWQSPYMTNKSLIFSKIPLREAPPRTQFGIIKIKKRLDKLLKLLEAKYV